MENKFNFSVLCKTKEQVRLVLDSNKVNSTDTVESVTDKINIAELLEDCPKGMELYSPIFGKVYLDKIRPHLAIVVTTDKEQGDFKEEFLYDGRYGMNGECMLFPSKDKTTWEGFNRPFKDGDIVVCDNSHRNYLQVFIFKNKKENNTLSYCYLMLDGDKLVLEEDMYYVTRLATEEEKQKLFDSIKANGYKWNAKTKTLEKLIEPNFKVGDRIRSKNDKTIIKTINYLYHDSYALCDNHLLYFKEQDEWELVPNKFDITTLVPFESRVLVRDTDYYKWEGAWFGRYDGNSFFIIGGIDWKYCIPYEGNEHLLGTTDDCDDFYKTWKKE